MPTRYPLVMKTLAGAALASTLLTGCGGSSGKAGAASPTPTVAATAPADVTGATAEIKRNWAGLFDYKNTDPKRIDLLQDGAKLKAAGAFKDDPHPKPLAARVTTVTFTSATSADVTYDLLQNGATLLPGAKGVAVYVDGMWKVSKVTFCQLLALGNAGKPVPGCA